MIIHSFDRHSPAKINPTPSANRIKCDACIITFSSVIEEYVLSAFPCNKIGEVSHVTGPTFVYTFSYKQKTFAFYKTPMGAPTAAGTLECAAMLLNTNKFVVFGGSGCLNREIAHGRVMVPTFAYRDEGTSYHYVEPADYIKVTNSSVVSAFMQESGIPYVEGKTWSTDAFFRETNDNFEKRKKDGCISVEMECAAYQAVCDFRGYELFYFLTSGDLLDAPKWDSRMKENNLDGTQHDTMHFAIALELAHYIG